jgi:translation elongation factor P/translation initiation factor 5A
MSAVCDPVQVSRLRKTHYVIIQGRPCKIIEVRPRNNSTINVFGLDIFTGTRYEMEEKSDAEVQMPTLYVPTYKVLDIVFERTKWL